ncbi:hypothetical protein GCM10028858_00400 [Halorubrum pallidum]|uniref:Secreted protein n=1 Tax=Halorubrum pallidum TaxID=1526114 RepID=A0ABD5T364_9EURY
MFSGSGGSLSAVVTAEVEVSCDEAVSLPAVAVIRLLGGVVDADAASATETYATETVAPETAVCAVVLVTED